MVHSGFAHSEKQQQLYQEILGVSVLKQLNPRCFLLVLNYLLII